MAELSLTDIFGANAVQDATTLTITKADLVDVGLTTGTTIAAEKLLVAIIKKAAIKCNPDDRETNADQSVSIEASTVPTFATRVINNVTSPYIRDTFTVELDKAYTSTGIDPDDY
ncbi:hypothetical protein ACQFX9_25835 [Aliinostoc sp. HNIBRCY26]|uniref:hypothetical protein n=1 Tax=Aliinostoc sp. HNIBRCY26 TaxID=3418997 RepID=UPI003D06B252